MRGVATALLAALALSAASAVPASAGAAEAAGNTTLVVGPQQAQLLERRGIELSGAGGAETEGRQIRLQVASGQIDPEAARIANSGALRFVAGSGQARRTVKLSGLRVLLGARPTLSAKLDGKRRTVFDLKASSARLEIDSAAGTARLRGARPVWRDSAAKAVSRRLGARVPRGALGKIRISVATIGGGDTPQSGPISSEPALLARPAGAVDVTSATLAWHVRDSWIRYVNSEEAPQATEGATPQAAIPESSHPCPDRPASTSPTLVYSYDFPFASGWYDPATGTAALYYAGGVRFSYPSRGIDITARNPEIEINGGASRAIFRLRGAAETPYPDQRAALLDLVPSTPTEAPPGSFSFPDPIRGSLTADGQTVFAGFYTPPNHGFGCFSVSFATG